MSFPATYDFNYYIGDTQTMVLSPENSNGEPFDLTNYTSAFIIASERATTPAWSVDASVTIDNNELICEIRPSVGLQLEDGKHYFYDIDIRSNVGGIEKVYTLLRGQINAVVGVNRSE